MKKMKNVLVVAVLFAATLSLPSNNANAKMGTGQKSSGCSTFYGQQSDGSWHEYSICNCADCSWLGSLLGCTCVPSEGDNGPVPAP